MEEHTAPHDERPGGRPRERSTRAPLAFAVAVVTFVVYWASPVQKMGDAEFTLLVSEQVLLSGKPALDARFWPQQPVTFYPGMRRGERWPRQVQPDGVRRSEARAAATTPANLQYIYPHGSPLLCVPFMAAARALGRTTITPSGGHDAAAEHALQRVAAALVAAGACAALFLLARQLLPAATSLTLCFSAAFGTQLWSTASRSLQAHAWSVALMAVVVWHLVARVEGRGRARPVAFATLCAWAFFVRPTAVFQLVPLGAFFAWHERRALPAFLATGALWGGAFLSYDHLVFHTWLPDYYTRGSGFGLGTFGVGLAGTLVSPSRGLFVCVPLTIWVLAAAAADARRVAQSRRGRGALLGAALTAIALHTLFIASFQNWWGGHSYGPRFTTDLVPLIALIAALVLRARAEAGRPLLVGLERAFVALALLVGATLNGAGALSEAGARWNLVPVPIGEDASRAFDWRRPQWLCALRPSLLPAPAPRARAEGAAVDEE